MALVIRKGRFCGRAVPGTWERQPPLRPPQRGPKIPVSGSSVGARIRSTCRRFAPHSAHRLTLNLWLQIPRFAFEKFPGATPTLTTQMKSVGEAMAIGRTWQESFQKALRSLETGLAGWSLPKNWKRLTRQQVEYNMRVPNPERMLVIKQASSSFPSLPPCCLLATDLPELTTRVFFVPLVSTPEAVSLGFGLLSAECR